MNNSIPPPLAPYLEECLGLRSLTLLTSVLNTPINWLLIRLLCLAVKGHENATTSQNVIFVSIWRSFGLWTEISKRCGLNLSEAISAKQVYYVDGLSTDSVAPESPREIIRLKSLALDDVRSAIYTALQTISNQANDSSVRKTTIIIDGIDFLLACNPDALSTDVQQALTEIQCEAHSVVVTCAADSPLLHNTDASATPIEHEHGSLVRQLGYQARLIFQLRPLETGHSKDVNGTVRVSRGGAWESADTETPRELEDGEWLYHVKGDGTVKAWGRGEA